MNYKKLLSDDEDSSSKDSEPTYNAGLTLFYGAIVLILVLLTAALSGCASPVNTATPVLQPPAVVRSTYVRPRSNVTRAHYIVSGRCTPTKPAAPSYIPSRSPRRGVSPSYYRGPLKVIPYSGPSLQGRQVCTPTPAVREPSSRALATKQVRTTTRRTYRVVKSHPVRRVAVVRSGRANGVTKSGGVACVQVSKTKSVCFT